MDLPVETMYQYVKRKLGENKGRMVKIAEETGLPYPSVYSIHHGSTLNPSVHTVQTLHDYFRKSAE
jgi:hypothetical protein